MFRNIVIILLLISSQIFAQVIPVNRCVDWKQTQYHFRFTVPEQVINLEDYGLTGDGSADNSDAFSQALDDAGNEPAILLFPPGDFLFNEPVVLKSNIVLKGSGSGNTTLLFDLQETNNHCIKISGTPATGYISVDGGYFFGSRKIITDSAFMFNAGDMVEIRENNGDWDSHPAWWATQVVGQMILLDSVKADTLFLHSSLRIDYDSLLNPVIRKINPIKNSSVECLKIKRLDEPPSGGGYNILITYAHNCRITGIESDTSVASHVYISQSLNIRVTGSYFHHSFKYNGKYTHGYGVTLSHRTSECVVENNVFKHLRHSMVIKTGVNGNIFGYNYSTDVYRSEYPHDKGGDICIHGHYPYANLFEGNIVENIILDHVWGPAGPFNTFFRNRAYNWGIIFTYDDFPESSYQNLAGNEVTNFSPSHGQYSLSGSNHFEYGNNILGEIIPAGTDSLPDKSYYLMDWPPFWNIYCYWPSVGLPNTLESGTIPAMANYVEGSTFTVCNDELIDKIFINKDADLLLWPNPASNEVNVKIPENSGKTIINIYAINGIKVFSSNYKGNEGEIKIAIKGKLTAGLYLLTLNSGKINKAAKFYVY